MISLNAFESKTIVANAAPTKRGRAETPISESRFLSNFIPETLLFGPLFTLKGLSFTQFIELNQHYEDAVFILFVRLEKKEGIGDLSPQKYRELLLPEQDESTD